MAKAWVHAISSAKKFGGKADDYIDIHLLMDSSKKAFPDNRHRAMTHNCWFIAEILPKIFGDKRVNSDGRTYSVVDVGEQHILEDYGMRFIPSLQDWLGEVEWQDWMDNGRGSPPSHAKIVKRHERRKFVIADEEAEVSDPENLHVD